MEERKDWVVDDSLNKDNLIEYLSIFENLPIISAPLESVLDPLLDLIQHTYTP